MDSRMLQEPLPVSAYAHGSAAQVMDRLHVSNTDPISKPHAAVVPWPGQGHINPMMHLSRQLARRGIAITFVNTEHNHLRMKKIQAQLNGLSTLQDEGLDIRLVGIPDGLPPNHPRIRGGSILEVCEATEKMGTVFEDLIQRLMLQEPPITFIISDIFMLFTQDVANKFGIPRVAFWTQSATCYLAHVLTAKGVPSLQTGTTQTLASAVLSEVSNLFTRIPGSPPLRLSDMPSFLRPSDPADFMFDCVTRPFIRIDESAWILLNASHELESLSLESLRKQQKNDLYTVGPVLPTDFLTGKSFAAENGVGLWPEDYSCLDWLDKQAPYSVFYIAFGSIAVLDRQQVQEIAIGLEACQLPLLWVVRPDLMYGESAIFPEGFVERIRSRALFISWAPQLQVLSHASVGGFLTHCGWNSTLESISRGVPMLCWPYFDDQMLNCRCIVDWWKVGLSLKADGEEVVWRGEVEKKVRAVMEGGEVRGRACELREALRRKSNGGGEGGGGSTVNNFDLFIHQLTRHRIKEGNGISSLHS